METVKPTCFSQPALACFTYVESNFRTTDKSFTSSLPIEALHLIIDSKSQPVELDNIQPMELHCKCAIKAKEKLAIILFFGF